jgi:hypothetical protein
MARNSGELRSGTVLLREHTQLPAGVQFNTQAALPGWRVVTGASSADIDRAISKAGWHSSISLLNCKRARLRGISNRPSPRLLRGLHAPWRN